MSFLVVDELKTTLSQSFSLANYRRYSIAAIRPRVYMHNAPSGTFTFSIKSGSDVLGSKDFTSAEIKSDLDTSNNYAHLFKNLTFDVPVLLSSGSYTLELSSSAYTFSESNYLGWIRNHENLFVEVSGDAVSLPTGNPKTFEIWEYKLPRYKI